MSNLDSDLADFIIAMLLFITIAAGIIIFIAGWTDDWFYLKGIGVILTTGLTAIALAIMRPKAK